MTTTGTHLDWWEQLAERLKQGQQDELDEAHLGRLLVHLVSVHERRHRKSLQLLKVTLHQGQQSKDSSFLNIQSYNQFL